MPDEETAGTEAEEEVEIATTAINLDTLPRSVKSQRKLMKISLDMPLQQTNQCQRQSPQMT